MYKNIRERDLRAGRLPTGECMQHDENNVYYYTDGSVHGKDVFLRIRHKVTEYRSCGNAPRSVACDTRGTCVPGKIPRHKILHLHNSGVFRRKVEKLDK